MKTNEEKLKQLLQISVENGWTPTFICKEIIADNCIEYEVANNIVKTELLPYPEAQYTLKGFVSLNDIVTNWELGEISFIEALCNANSDKINEYLEANAVQSDYRWIMWSDWEQVIQLWSWDSKTEKGRPTSQRLDWLFDTFNHLLN